MMDGRSMLVSHMLDDIRSVCSSDDEACSIDGDASSPSRSLAQSIKHKAGDGDPALADAYAYVAAPDQIHKSQKSARSNSTSRTSSRQHPVSTAVVTSTVPQKPVKWQLRLADRATAAVNLEAQYQVPPHVLFDLLADPFQHERIFDAIEAADAELLEEDGPRRKWRLDYTARWNFWKVSGVCENRLFMWTDRDAGTVTFKLREPGFLKRYEGTWTIKPACGTPMAECYGTDFDSPASSTSSSPATSPSSSRGSSPMRGAAMAPLGSSSSSDVVSWPGTPTPAAANGGTSTGGIAGALSGFRMSPLASVNIMAPLPAAAGSNSSGSYLPPVHLTGAVAAIARMQAGWQENVSSSLNNLSSLANNITSSAGAGSSNALGNVGLALQQQLAKVNNPWAGLLPGSSSSSSSKDASAKSQKQQRRRELPTTALIIAETYTSPKITPPYPLNALLKNQSKGQVEDMLTGLVQAAATEAAAAAQQR